MANIIVDFTVYSDSPLFLHVMDLSDWQYSEDLTAYCQITPPSAKKPKNYSFTKHKTNSFNSNNLGLSCLNNNCDDQEYIDLPDGIYTIKLLSGYENVDKTKYYLKTDRFELEYAKVLRKHKTNVEQDFINLMTRINYTLEVSKSFTINGDFYEANKYFQEAKKLLKTYMECKDCV